MFFDEKKSDVLVNSKKSDIEDDTDSGIKDNNIKTENLKNLKN